MNRHCEERCDEAIQGPPHQYPPFSGHSRGEITRREIADEHGSYVSFGALLGQLCAHRLPLPRVPSDPNNPGIELIKKLAERAGPRVGRTCKRLVIDTACLL
jgi:hypothetical protein